MFGGKSVKTMAEYYERFSLQINQRYIFFFDFFLALKMSVFLRKHPLECIYSRILVRRQSNIWQCVWLGLAWKTIDFIQGHPSHWIFAGLGKSIRNIDINSICCLLGKNRPKPFLWQTSFKSLKRVRFIRDFRQFSPYIESQC